MSANFTPEKEDYKLLPPFKMQVLTNFPYIEADFDALTNYQLLCKVVEYLNEVIANENEVTEQVTSLYNAYVALQNYVNTYFDNLDLTGEVSAKLDEMATDGTLTNLIKEYVDPIYEAYEEAINLRLNSQDSTIEAFGEDIASFKSAVNSEIDNIDNKVEAATSGSPAGVYATAAALSSADPDHDKIYVVTEDGKWYYYDTSLTAWTSGGTYQATEIAANSIGLNELKSEVIEDKLSISTINLLDPYACQYNKGISTSGEISDSATTWLTHKINVVAGDIIQISKSSDYFNTLARPNAWTRLCLFSEDDTLIAYTSTLSNYTVPNDLTGDGYVIIQIPYTLITFDDRFKTVIRKLSDSDNLNDNFDRNFISYYNQNNDIVNSYVSRYSLEPSFAKSFEYAPDFKWEVGSLATSTGQRTSSTSRIRTINMQYLTKGTVIKMTDSNYIMGLLFYNDDSSYDQGTDWLTTTNTYTMTETKYVRIIIRDIYNGTMTTDDIPTIVSKLKIIGNIENIYNIIAANELTTKYGTNYIGYVGDKINLKNKLYYDQQSFECLAQDSAVYGNKVFIFKSTGQFQVYDFTTNTTSVLTDLDQIATIAPHCNTAFFGTQKYDESDDYPILYVNAYNTTGLPLGTLYGYRVQELYGAYVTTLVQTISIGFVNETIWRYQTDPLPYGNFILNTDSNELYAYTLRGDKTRFFKFNMPSLAAGSTVTLQQSDILDMFDLEYMRNIQGACYCNNQIFCLSGLQTEWSYLYVINLGSKSINSRVYLGGLFQEPESIFIYHDDIYVGSYSYFFKLY